MTASFPTSVHSFTTLVDGVDDVLASHQNDPNLEIAAIENYLIETATEKTVSSGVLTVDKSRHKVQPQSGTTDDIDTISGMPDNSLLILYASDAGTDTLTFKHNTGNIYCFGGADVQLSYGFVLAYYNGTKVILTGGGSSVWGGITGTLSNQSDLNTALLDKIPVDGWIAGTGTWSYSSADAPTFVISINADVTALIGVGDKIKLTQTTVKYFIVTAVGTFSAGATLVTVYGGTDYTLANAAISSPHYSHSRSAFGFPIDPSKWTVTATDSSDRTQTTPTQNQWYNLGSVSISMPIGLWRVKYIAVQRPAESSGTNANQKSTLSTANNSESDAGNTIFNTLLAPTGSIALSIFVHLPSKIISAASKTTYYLNALTTNASQDSIAHRGDISPTIITLESAYL